LLHRGKDVALVYGNRNAGSIVFREELGVPRSHIYWERFAL
jgi:ferredoxin-NADP reductase